jgi:hypothetical protein
MAMITHLWCMMPRKIINRSAHSMAGPGIFVPNVGIMANGYVPTKMPHIGPLDIIQMVVVILAIITCYKYTVHSTSPIQICMLCEVSTHSTVNSSPHFLSRLPWLWDCYAPMADIPTVLKAALATHQLLFDNMACSQQDILSFTSSITKSMPTPIKDSHPSIHYLPLIPLPDNQAPAIWAMVQPYLAGSVSHNIEFTPDEWKFFIHTGASITISNCHTDFVATLRPLPITMLKGISSGLMVEGIGTTVYSFRTDDNSILHLCLSNVLYVPTQRAKTYRFGLFSA